MKVAEAVRHCHAWIEANAPDAPRLLDDLYRRQAERDITYKDRPISTFLRPCFITDKQRELISRTSQILLECAERITGQFLVDPAIREAIGLHPEEEEFALLESGLKRRLVVARPDCFLSGDSLKYLELNCDSPAGVAWTDLHEEVFLELPLMREQSWSKSLGTSNCRRLMLDAFLAAFEEFGLQESPVAAIVDWQEVTTRPEFQIIQRYLAANGIHAVVADPRDLELRGSGLYACGTRVNLVYRRAIIREVLEKKDEKGVRDFLEACHRRLVCVVNPFCAKVSGSKAVMALLSDQAYDELFTSRQNDIRRRFVPWTRLLREGKVDFRGRLADLFELASEEKDDLVVKPTSGYGGKGVLIGRETGQADWDDILHKAAGDPGEWTLQEYVEIPEELLPVLEPDLQFQTRKANINPYLFRGVYAGCFMRLSRSSIINVGTGGGMVPVFVLP